RKIRTNNINLKIMAKTTKTTEKKLHKAVMCVHCKNSNHKIKDCQIYCNKKRKNMSAFALDCYYFE
ncbi:MAG TPA: hypothetical protein PLP76_10105, partial [Bacteroidales bacterium]|nr:hypothetical protein [Bacteroidales bacterium]